MKFHDTLKAHDDENPGGFSFDAESLFMVRARH